MNEPNDYFKQRMTDNDIEFEIKENNKRIKVIELIERLNNFNFFFETIKKKKEYFNKYNIGFNHFEKVYLKKYYFPIEIIKDIYHKTYQLYIKDIMKWIIDVYKLRDEYPFVYSGTSWVYNKDDEILLLVCEIFCISNKIEYFKLNYNNKLQCINTIPSCGHVCRILIKLIYDICEDIHKKK
tara:strand:- start:1327 stop:1872 length:546 start_codon:yes stop_codon:yes gene_type:complete